MGQVDGGSCLGAQEQAVLAELFDKEWRPLYRFVSRLTASPAEAEDVVSIVFEIAARRLSAGQQVTPQLLRTIARRRSIDEWRRAKTARRYLDGAGKELAPSCCDTDMIDDRLKASAKLMSLSERERLALVYRYFLDLPVKEVATRLNASPKATESLLTRARCRALAASAA